MIQSATEISPRVVPDSQLTGEPASVTFVLCIEAGKMEDMALRLVTSLRKWGGAFAQNHVLAVNPRRGPAIRANTREQLHTLGVSLIQSPTANPVPWFPIYNKGAAIRIAEQEAPTQIACFLDTDVLVLGEPAHFALPAECDFRGCPLDCSGATRGPSDPNDHYWHTVGKTIGADLDNMAWVRDHRDQRLMRMYFNSGVFAFRRGLGFGDAYADDFLKVLMCGYRSPTAGIYHTSQVTLPLTLHRLGMKVECLPLSHHTPFVSDIPRPVFESVLPAAKIVHYFRSLTPGQFDRFASLLNTSHPQTGKWLTDLGPLETRQPAMFRLINKPLYEWRRWKYRHFERRCLVPN